MKVLSYVEALEICKEKTSELTKKKELAKFCREHDLRYHAVQVYIQGAKEKKYPKKKYPKLITSFLRAIGHKVIVQSHREYNFFFEEDL